MQQYSVTGMSCAACSARVEKAVSAVDGVTECAVNLLTNSMTVEGTADAATIIKAVENAGYGAKQKQEQTEETPDLQDESQELKDTETPAIRKRLIASLIPLAFLMYVSMGHMMLDWPVPAFLKGNPISMGIYEMLVTIIVMMINRKFFVNGFKGLLHKAPNMDTLVALGASASFGFSTYTLFKMTTVMMDHEQLHGLMDGFYFESAAMILTLITVGKMLEAMSKGRTTDALKGLMKLAPKTAVLVRDGVEEEVPVRTVKVGDYFVVRPGSNVPVDGVVIEGSGAVDESMLTGESIPVDKVVGDAVSASTANVNGYLICEATRVGKDTTIAQIIHMVSDASATKAPIAKVADKVSGVFVPTVMGIALVTFVIWMITGVTVGFALERAISVLVISCPCALGLATPVAIMVASGVGAKNKIMFKNATALEQTGKTQIVVLDKTGTITKGEPEVACIVPEEGVTQEELLSLALSLEEKSEHPLARAVVKKAVDMGITPMELDDFKNEVGSGVLGVLKGQTVYGGNLKYVAEKVRISDYCLRQSNEMASKGMTPIFFAMEDHLLGLMGIADMVKEDSRDAIAQLQNMGIRVVMLTGDNETTARAIGKEAGVTEIVAGVLPDGKEAVIRQLQEKGRVMMVGDGINDAPALTRADIGVAIGAGTDIAVDAASIILVNSRLTDVAAAIRLSKKTLKNIYENLFWAFIYNVIGIPLAAGAWIVPFGLVLKPMFRAAAMSLSSFCVVSNALRLNLCKLYGTGKDRPGKHMIQGEILAKNENVRESTSEAEYNSKEECSLSPKGTETEKMNQQTVKTNNKTKTIKMF